MVLISLHLPVFPFNHLIIILNHNMPTFWVIILSCFMDFVANGFAFFASYDITFFMILDKFSLLSLVMRNLGLAR